MRYAYIERNQVANFKIKGVKGKTTNFKPTSKEIIGILRLDRFRFSGVSTG